MSSIVHIDGFSQLVAVKAYLRQQIKRKEPAFVVVEGGSDSGMSSAANAVLAWYRDLQAIPKDRFVALRMPMDPSVNNHLERDLYREWTLEFYKRATSSNLGLNLAPVQSEFYGIRSLSGADTWHYDLQDVLVKVQAAFVPPNEGFGTRFRQIKTADVVIKAKTVFNDVRTVCVFTAVVGTLPSDFATQTMAQGVHFWQLGSVTAAEAEQLISCRWGDATTLPFDPGKFGPFCAGRGVGAVIKTADELLQSMARANPPRGTWPDPSDQWPVDTRLDCRQFTLNMLEALSNGRR